MAGKISYAPYISTNKETPIYSLNLTTDRNPPLKEFEKELGKSITSVLLNNLGSLPTDGSFILLVFGHGSDKETKIYSSSSGENPIERDTLIAEIRKHSKARIIFLACVCGGSAFGSSTGSTDKNIEYYCDNFDKTTSHKFLDWVKKFLS